jgi:hypothetical protein
MPDAYHDKLDIIELFNRYAEALDQRAWDRLRGLYTPNATAEQPEGAPLLEGPDAIVGMIGPAIDWLGPTHHSLSNYIVEVDGDRAQASCYVRGYHAGAREQADKAQETLGRLSARLVRTPQGWRFDHFLEQIMLSLGSPEVFKPDLLPAEAS